jgi:hypothetical protein
LKVKASFMLKEKMKKTTIEQVSKGVSKKEICDEIIKASVVFKYYTF